MIEGAEHRGDAVANLFESRSGPVAGVERKEIRGTLETVGT